MAMKAKKRKKATKRKRHLRGTAGVHASDKKSVRAMMPYA